MKKSQKTHACLREIGRNYDKYLMMLPFMILFVIFIVMPVIVSMVLSFTDFNMLQMPNFTKLENYKKLLLQDHVFITSLKNTSVLALITGPISYFACLIVAWLVNELGPKMRTIMTILFYAPSISSSVYVIWTYLLGGDRYSGLNGLLMGFGVIKEPQQWLSDPKYMLTMVIIVQLWLSLGTGFLAFIAGLQGVDRSLYEAASIDGIRNRYQELLYVTIPQMGPQLLFGAVMQISSSFAVGQISIDLLGNPSTDYAGSTIVTHMIDYGTMRYEMGYACTIASFLFAMMLIANAFIRKILRKYL